MSKRSRSHLVDKIVRDKNGRVTTVKVRPDEQPAKHTDYAAYVPSVIKSIDGVAANSWMRLIRDSDADVYEKGWQASESELRERGWLVPVSEVGFTPATQETKDHVNSWLDAPEGLSSRRSRINPASIDLLTDGDNLRLDVIHFYLQNEKAVFDESMTNKRVVTLAKLDSGEHYIVDGKHRVAASIIKGRNLKTDIINIPVSKPKGK